MTSDDQPTQPLTDACPTCSGPTRETTHMICLECGTDYAATPPRKLTDNALEVLRAGLAEVDRIRADLSGVRTALINAHEAGMSLGQDVERLRNEATGTALGHLAKIERLQSQRDALVRKLGLDWGPDEFGDLSAVHVQSIEITNCPDEYCPGWKDSGICPNDYRHRY